MISSYKQGIHINVGNILFLRVANDWNGLPRETQNILLFKIELDEQCHQF